MATPSLSPDFRDFLASLHAHRADYLIVGGYAVALHGHVRNTNDIDIWVGNDPQNAERVYNAIVDFAGTADNLTPGLFSEPETNVFMGVEPNRLDVFTTIPGVEFADCLPRAQSMALDGINVNVIDLEDLIKNKQATGRPLDLSDVENLRGEG